MYDKILVTLDATPTDRAIIDHIKRLAKLMNSHIVLFTWRMGGPPGRSARMR